MELDVGRSEIEPDTGIGTPPALPCTVLAVVCGVPGALCTLVWLAADEAPVGKGSAEPSFELIAVVCVAVVCSAVICVA